MGLDAELLRADFEVAVSRQPDLTHVFYGELFRRHPEARPLFAATDMPTQERMLAEALSAAIDHLEDAGWLEANLGALGARHAGFDVTAEMYGWVAESLVATLAGALGDDWGPQHEAAWQDACTAIASLMLAGYPTDKVAST